MDKEKTVFTVLVITLLQFSAVSQTAYHPIFVSKDIELIKLSENAFVHVSWYNFPGFGRVPCNGLIFINKGEAFLFDTPATGAMTKDLVAWMRDSMKLKIAGFIPNHWHSDCMGGLGYLQSQKIGSYANQKTIEIAKSKNLPVPEHGFKDSLRLKLGDQTIQCYYLGAAHSVDNIVIWIPSERILFAGCIVKSLASKDLGNTDDGDLNAYPVTIYKLLKLFPSAKVVIPGHGDFGGVELIRHTLELTIKYQKK